MSYYETERDKAIIDSLKEIGSQLKQINEAISKEQSERYLVKENGEVVPLTPKTEWISVDERLPEGNGRFLLVDSEGYMLVSTWYTDGGWFMPFCHGNAITHWMPLPEPPMMKGGAE